MHICIYVTSVSQIVSNHLHVGHLKWQVEMGPLQWQYISNINPFKSLLWSWLPVYVKSTSVLSKTSQVVLHYRWANPYQVEIDDTHSPAHDFLANLVETVLLVYLHPVGDTVAPTSAQPCRLVQRGGENKNICHELKHLGEEGRANAASWMSGEIERLVALLLLLDNSHAKPTGTCSLWDGTEYSAILCFKKVTAQQLTLTTWMSVFFKAPITFKSVPAPYCTTMQRKGHHDRWPIWRKSTHCF